MYKRFNYTRQGERNAENCLVLRSPVMAEHFLRHWFEHAAHSTPLEVP